MITRIYEMAAQLGMSRGELLQLARSIAPVDFNLRTIDLLTMQERFELVSCLESMAWVGCEMVCG